MTLPPTPLGSISCSLLLSVGYDDTFKPWLDEFFSKNQIAMEEIFPIKEKKRGGKNDNEAAAIARRQIFQQFRAKYGKVHLMNLEFLDDLRNMLVSQSQLSPDNKFIKGSVEHLDKISACAQIYNSNVREIKVPEKINDDVQRFGALLYEIIPRQALIFDVFDNIVNDMHRHALEMHDVTTYSVRNLLNICKIDNNIAWLEMIFGPLKQPLVALNLHNTYARRHRETLFNLCNEWTRVEYNRIEIEFLVIETINYLYNMINLIDERLLTVAKRSSWYYAKDFLRGVSQKPNLDSFLQKVDIIYESGPMAALDSSNFSG